ncbi:fructose-bisphosphate aldolase [Myxozyma melibiosi]|uniref:Fructose-bisphosphate aldolase n=1 Tax=Myxozyma melibiosi TaxID=54550 RepID=A0ABR1FFN6_9ASCO
MPAYPENNRTWQILQAAERGGYAVPAFNCYNADGVLGSIKAAENLNAPAMVEIFPFSLHFHGPEFVKFAAAACHAAKVPIALHLDHCTLPADVYTALELPFDSIMVDASTEDPEANIEFVSKIVKMAEERGITIEAEMGRIQGGEDGVPTVDMEALYTEPEFAADFMQKTGVHYLAPSFGNIHGPYPPGGPEKYWQLDRLAKIKELNPTIPLVLHGAYPIIPDLYKKTVELGMRKVNLNRNLHDDYLDYLKENIGKVEMTGLQENSIALWVKEAERCIKMLGCDGKAGDVKPIV